MTQCLPQLALIGAEQHIAQRGKRKIALGQFQHREIAILSRIATIGDGILIASVGLDASRVAQQQTCLADQVQRHVRQRDVFFQHRAVAAPFRQTMTQHQRVVAQM